MFAKTKQETDELMKTQKRSTKDLDEIFVKFDEKLEDRIKIV